MNRALIIIDMQKCYLDKKCYDEGLISRINSRIVQAQTRGELIIYVRNAGKRSGEIYVSDFAEDLAIVSDHIFTKTRMSAFSAPAFVDFLHNRVIKDITLAGIDGNCCVANTALDAEERGFDVTFPLSLVGARNKKRFEETVRQLKDAGVIIYGE